MRVCACVVLVVVGSFLAWPVRSDPPQADPDKQKLNPERLKGMKAAVADLAAGKLSLRYPPAHDEAVPVEYKKLLKKDCGVEAEVVGKAGLEMGGYNDVMEAEIEHRFGKGTLARLRKAAVVVPRRLPELHGTVERLQPGQPPGRQAFFLRCQQPPAGVPESEQNAYERGFPPPHVVVWVSDAQVRRKDGGAARIAVGQRVSAWCSGEVALRNPPGWSADLVIVEVDGP